MKRALLAVLAVAAAPAFAQQPVNPIHPLFAPLAADGSPALTAAAFSADATCGACHDAKYVAAHTGHGQGRARATCVQCHLGGGRLDPAALRAAGLISPDGRLVREAVRIGKPRAASCQACHGVIAPAGSPVVLPADLLAAPVDGRTWSLTLGEGAIVSPQRMADSFLNLEGKAALASPWDVHAAKLVDCVACHHAGNDPARVDPRKAQLRYLTTDPRRTSTAEFLVRPDHRLAELDCRSCHDAGKAHGFLPYRARHVEVLACQACHLQAPAGPAAEMVDATVADAGGNPVVRLRNVAAGDDPLNAAPVTPLRPLLVMRTGKDGARRLTPVNVVSRWRWASGSEEVPFDLVRRAFQEGDAVPPALLAALDADRDGSLTTAERRLDTGPKVEAVAARLRALGVAEPRVEGLLEPHVLAHGVPSRERALRDCEACHAADSRVASTYHLAAWIPGGVPPRPPDGTGFELAGVVEPGATGGLVLRQDGSGAPAGLHVLGHSRESWSNLLGLAVFVAVALGVSGHGLVRVVLRGRRRAHPRPRPSAGREYVFGRYERLWHWTMAAAGVTLMATGLGIHFAGAAPFPLAGAVALHNAAALVLTVNASLALFYHLATAAIRNFIPAPRGLLARILSHMEYQARGIFLGGPHPENAPGHKLNPLQQLTYLALLNVLFPLQIGTGALVWAVGHWPALGSGLGGLSVLAPLHNLGSWLFLAFFVLHVYLVTTGRTVGDHLESMVTGYRERPRSRKDRSLT